MTSESEALPIEKIVLIEMGSILILCFVLVNVILQFIVCEDFWYQQIFFI